MATVHLGDSFQDHQVPAWSAYQHLHWKHRPKKKKKAFSVSVVTFEISYLFSFFLWPYRCIIAGIFQAFDEPEKLFITYPLKV